MPVLVIKTTSYPCLSIAYPSPLLNGMSIALTNRIKLFCCINVRGVLTNDHVLSKRKGLGTTVLTFNDAHKSPNPTHKQRTAIVTLETIVWLPVLAILLAAVIEMGLIMTGTMHVAAATRLGAKLAAETPNLSAANDDTAAANIKTSIDNYFENAGYGANASAGVRLQHTVGNVAGQRRFSGVSGTCPEINSPLFPMPRGNEVMPGVNPNSVRVVVCIEIPKVAPNVLKTFGFDTTGMTLEMFTTFPYENL